MDGSGAPIESTRARLQRRHAMLKNERTSFEEHWRELAENFVPRRGRWQLSETNRGEKKSHKIIDGTPRFSARVLASGMMAGLTSPARPWFRLTTPDQQLAEFASVKTWLHDVSTRMREVFAKSGLYNALPQIYGEMGVFGTGCALGLDDNDSTLRFFPQTVGSYWLAQSSRMQVDTLFRQMRWTVRQCAQEFGLKACSTTVRSLASRGLWDADVDIIHVIEPNEAFAPGMLGSQGKPIASCWYEMNGSEDATLRVSGYYESPLIAPRWEITGEDVYGSSPGMDALGDAKALQFQQKRKAQAIDKMIDPPLVGPASLRNQRVSLLPGDVTYLSDQQAGAGLKSVFDLRLDPSMLLEDTREIQGRLETAFYADLFLMLAMSDRRQITAREVEERHEEKLLMLGPVLERLNDELLNPLVDRTFGAMLRRGDIPPPPRELEGVELKVDYISVLAQAQKMVGLSAVDKLAMYTTSIAALVPDVLDKVDWDQSVDEYAEMLGVSPKIVVSDDAVQAKREARAQQAQMQQMAAMAQPMQQGAQAIKTLAEAEPTAQSVLASLTGGGGVPA